MNFAVVVAEMLLIGGIASLLVLYLMKRNKIIRDFLMILLGVQTAGMVMLSLFLTGGILPGGLLLILAIIIMIVLYAIKKNRIVKDLLMICVGVQVSVIILAGFYYLAYGYNQYSNSFYGYEETGTDYLYYEENGIDYFDESEETETNYQHYETDDRSDYQIHYSTDLVFGESNGKWGVDSIGNCTDKYINIPTKYQGKTIEFIQIEAFQDSDIVEVYIPGCVEKIGGAAFLRCKDLKSVVMESGIKLIGNSAFRECTSLKTMVVPESVEEIHGGAFMDCTNLKTVYLPSTLTKLQWDIFENDTELTDVYYNGSWAQWEKLLKDSGYQYYDGWLGANVGFTLHCNDVSVDYPRLNEE